MTCDFCNSDGGEVLWRNQTMRVIRVRDVDYPAFCRVIWNRHVKEMTDLNSPDQMHLMQTVFAVEKALREIFTPDKINLASLGNMTPHLHWHVIPRFSDDRHFPQPVWAAPQRPAADRNFNPAEFDKKMKLALQRAVQ
ncbi:MAG: HIT family protein [Burkholderiales bacterium]